MKKEAKKMQSLV